MSMSRGHRCLVTGSVRNKIEKLTKTKTNNDAGTYKTEKLTKTKTNNDAGRYLPDSDNRKRDKNELRRRHKTSTTGHPTATTELYTREQQNNATHPSLLFLLPLCSCLYIKRKTYYTTFKMVSVFIH